MDKILICFIITKLVQSSLTFPNVDSDGILTPELLLDWRYNTDSISIDISSRRIESIQVNTFKDFKKL